MKVLEYEKEKRSKEALRRQNRNLVDLKNI